jgi:putative copper resistance protein D
MSDVVPVGAEVAANAWLYAAVLLAVGVCATRWWLRLDVRSGLLEAAVDALEHRLGRLALRTATVVAIALVVRMWAHTVSTFGWSEALTLDALVVVGIQSRWGHAWQIQMAAALALVGSSLWVRLDRRSGWPAATLASVGVCATLPLVGHAAGSTGRILLHAVHLLGAGLWIGTLAVVLIVGRPKADAVLLPRFSPVAFSGMTTLAVTGAFTAYLYVGSLSNLWTTLYGRVLSAKIAVFAAVGFCGWLNWRQFSGAAARGTRKGESGAASRRTVVLPLVEVCLAAAVVILTGLLTQLEHP